MADARDVRDLLDDRPDLEPAVAEVLEPEEPWSFEEVDVDSGAFGELVSRGVVEKQEDGYRVVNRSAVTDALAGDVSEDGESTVSDLFSDLDAPQLSVGRVEAIVVTLLLGLVAAVRLVPLRSVFRNGHVVLSGNDPYFYRYLIEEYFLSRGVSLSTMPKTLKVGEPLFLGTLGVVSQLLGGTPEVVGQLLAWYPVVTAVAGGLFVYVLSLAVTSDKRVAIASLALFAIVPGHAFRTSLGFADHHAFDYLWLVLTAASLAVIVAELQRTEPVRIFRVGLATGGLAAGITGQLLAWSAGPLLILPLGIYLAVDAILAVGADRRPARTGVPVLLGVGLAAAATWLVHQSLGWQSTTVAATPTALLAGGVLTVSAAEVASRLELSTPTFAGIGAVGSLVGGVTLSQTFPQVWSRLLTDLSERLVRTGAVAETGSLFGKSLGWLLLFGFVFLLAVPYLVSGTRRVFTDGRFVPITVYTWYFLLLAAVQIRFVGEMAPFVAVFAGIGFVHLAERVDVTSRRPVPFEPELTAVESLPRPERSTITSVVLIFLLVGSLSFVQIPVKVNQVTYSDEQYETAMWMDDYADDRGWAYPQDYVLSQWGENRFYNYFVNGQSSSYGYAKTRFVPFVTSSDERLWYNRLRDRVGFVVVTDAVVSTEAAFGTRLYVNNGSREGGSAGLAHFRLVHISADRQYKVFSIVPGAVLTGTTAPNATVTVETTVSVGPYTVEYVRQTTADATGNYSIVVAHPGRYVIGNRSVTVPPTAVRNGTTVSVTDRAGT